MQKTPVQSDGRFLHTVGERGEGTAKRIKARLDDLGEGFFESPLTDIANQMSKSAYNGKDVEQNLSEANKQQIMANAIINTILAALLEESN